MDFEDAAQWVQEMRGGGERAAGAAHSFRLMIEASNSIEEARKAELIRALSHVYPSYGTFDASALDTFEGLLLAYDEYNTAKFAYALTK